MYNNLGQVVEEAHWLTITKDVENLKLVARVRTIEMRIGHGIRLLNDIVDFKAQNGGRSVDLDIATCLRNWPAGLTFWSVSSHYRP